MQNYEIKYLNQDNQTIVTFETAPNAHEAWFQVTKKDKNYQRCLHVHDLAFKVVKMDYAVCFDGRQVFTEDYHTAIACAVQLAKAFHEVKVMKDSKIIWHYLNT